MVGKISAKLLNFNGCPLKKNAIKNTISPEFQKFSPNNGGALLADRDG